MKSIPMPLNERMAPVKFEILEGKDGGRLKVRGRFQMADTQNGNGRVYPGSLWERVLKDENIQAALKERRMLGEVEHPKDGLTDLSRVSHVITRLVREGKEIIGEAEILPTPGGRIVEALLRSEIPVGVSSRGKGSSESKEGVEVVKAEDYVLETFDFVFAPSTPGAFANISENLQGAERAECPIGEKIEAVCGLGRRAGEIKRLAESSSVDDLRRYHTDLVEAEVKVHTIRSTAPEPQKVHSLFTETATRIAESRRLVEQRLGSVVEADDDDEKDDKDKKNEDHKPDCACVACKAKGKSEAEDDDKADDEKKDKKNEDHKPDCACVACKAKSGKEERKKLPIEERYAILSGKHQRALAVIENLTTRLESVQATSRGLATRLQGALQFVNETLRRRKNEALARHVVIDESVAKPSKKETVEAAKPERKAPVAPKKVEAKSPEPPKEQIEESVLPVSAAAAGAGGDAILAQAPLNEGSDSRVQATLLAVRKHGWK